MALNPAEQIALDMRALPEETRKALRPRLRAAGEAIASDARARAGWSSRIPGTIKVRTSFRSGREGVTIVAGGADAPHARYYEDLPEKGFFRHPVYGHRDRWVSQTTRPFLIPAAEAQQGRVTSEVLSALDDAASAIGFGG